jgi:hypothetical protein
MNSSDVTAGTNATATHYNNLRKDLKDGITDINVATDQATVTFDLSLGKVHQVTLAGNRTLALSNTTVGQAFILRIVQDATGSRTVTWFSGIKWPNAVVPTLATTGNKVDVFGFIVTASGVYDGFILGQRMS